ncbi:MAG: TlpA disulfide reductase family protein [Actinomycetota bacterium]|nr:TlpA disulfide reductase family protein [Actinomycetota bacterium]MDA8302163.1 TlpA disulfide reductase family protein [Actinomycetota bacterium]
MQPTATDNTGDAPAPAAPPDVAAPERTRPAATRRRRRRSVLWAALAMLLVAAGVVTVLGLSPPATQVEAQSPLVGQPAPAIPGPTITGQPFSLAGLQGHFVVVDFFSSWCVACRQEAPQLARFVAQQAGPSGARLVGVIFEDTVPAIRQFLGPELGRYPVVQDPGGRIALDYGVDNPPEKYLIAPNGVIFDKVIGPVTAALLDQLIAKAKAAGW